jgi:hypothetical protein
MQETIPSARRNKVNWKVQFVKPRYEEAKPFEGLLLGERCPGSSGHADVGRIEI